MRITDIYWERIYLHIKVDGCYSADDHYILATKDNACCPLHFDENVKEFVINITNIGGGRMLSNGDWYIKRLGKAGDVSFLPAGDEVCRKCTELDRIFWYGEGNYACIFSILPDYSAGEPACFIRSAFMKPNRRPARRFVPKHNAPLKKRLYSLCGDLVGKCLHLLYSVLSFFSVKKGNRILLMSENRAMGGNLKALDDRLKERGLDKSFKISYHFAKVLDGGGVRMLLTWVRLAALCSKQDFIFIDDHEPFFEHIRLDKRTTFVQLWHAGVGFKSVGLSRFGKEGCCHPFATAHRKYDYAVVGGEKLRDVYAEVFGIDREKCLPYGLPRNDGYLDRERIESFRSDFYKKYPQFSDKEIILFAPTYRGDDVRDAYYPFDMLDQKKIFDMCGDKRVFLIKMHPFVKEKIQIDEAYASRIFDFSFFDDINSLFYVSDVLVTDYSSSIYEYALLKKPIVFFAFDKEKYELERSLHRSLDDNAPGKVCSSLEEVLQAIDNGDLEREKLEKFIDENIHLSDTLASDRVIDEIILKR